MINLFINRIYRSIKIEPQLFDEVQKDKKATIQAAIVVVLSSAAAGVGAIQLGATNFFIAPLLSLISWVVWAYIVYFVGVKLFPEKNTETTHSALLRSIGFSSAPGIIRIFAFNSDLMTVTFIGSAFWMLACMVVAVKQTMNYLSLWKAFGIVIISWLVQAFFLIIFLVLTRNF